MRHPIIATAAALGACAALAPAAGARPAPLDAPVPPQAAGRVVVQHDDSGLEAGWAVLLCGGAALAGGAAGFAGGRVRRSSPVAS